MGILDGYAQKVRKLFADVQFAQRLQAKNQQRRDHLGDGSGTEDGLGCDRLGVWLHAGVPRNEAFRRPTFFEPLDARAYGVLRFQQSAEPGVFFFCTALHGGNGGTKTQKGQGQLIERIFQVSGGHGSVSFAWIDEEEKDGPESQPRYRGRVTLHSAVCRCRKNEVEEKTQNASPVRSRIRGRSQKKRPRPFSGARDAKPAASPSRSTRPYQRGAFSRNQRAVSKRADSRESQSFRRFLP